MGRVGAILLVVAVIALPSIGCAQQKLYKWTDENGVVHYSDSIPPEYGSREYANPARRLEWLGSRIKLTEVYLGNLRKRLVDLQAEARNFKPYSTKEDAPPIPENLAIDMSRTTAAIAQCEQSLARMRAVQAALKESFEDDEESLDDDGPRLIEA